MTGIPSKVPRKPRPIEPRSGQSTEKGTTTGSTNVPGSDHFEERLRTVAEGVWQKVRAAGSVTGEAGHTLLEAMLERDRAQKRRDLDPSEIEAMSRRELKRRISRALCSTPYGASRDEIQAALLDDPHIRMAWARDGDLDRSRLLEQIEILALEELLDRQRYFEARFGSEAEAHARTTGPFRSGESMEERLELLKAFFAAPPFVLANPRSLVPTKDPFGYTSLDLVADVAVSQALKGSPEAAPGHYAHRYPASEHKAAEGSQYLLSGADPQLLVLRRTIQQALPCWTFEQIAEAHNRHAEYYAPFTGGPKTVTGAEVEALLARYPEVLDAETLYRNRDAFYSEIRECIMASQPGEDLATVIDRILDGLERRGRRLGLLPMDVLDAIMGAPDLARALNARFDLNARAKASELYPVLAERVKALYGDRLHRYSISEIAARMRLLDPSFSEALLLDLIACCPDVFGTQPYAQAERNFVLALQVARTMHRMWSGASYDDVAQFLVGLGPLGQVPSDFSGKDIELLHCYDFVPKWPGGRKPDDAQAQSQLAQSALMRELSPALAALLPGDTERIRTAVIQALFEAPERETVPDGLEQLLDEAFCRALRMSLAKIFGALGPEGQAENHEGYAAYEAFLEAKPGSELDLEQLSSILSSSLEMGKNIQHHRALARLLTMSSKGSFAAPLQDRTWTLDRESKLGGMIPQAEACIAALSLTRALRSEVSKTIELHGFRSRELRRELDRFAQIPLVLEATERIVQATLAEYRGADRPLPLANARVVMIQHELGQAYPQVAAFEKLGMDPGKCIFVGVPYHPNHELEVALVRSRGVDGRFFAQGDLDSLHRTIERSIDETMAKRAPDEPVLIVCDGPFARRYFEEKYLRQDPSLARWVRFTEQTARGDRDVDRAAKNMRVVSYARYEGKVLEAPYIGRAGVRAINSVLVELKDTLENKVVLVTSLGPIGRATADAMKGAGANVIAYDPNVTSEIREWSERSGIQLVNDPVAAASGAFMIAGGAGATSITKEMIDASGPNTYFVSFSSELMEIDVRHLAERSTDAQGTLNRILAAQVNQQPTYIYRLDDGTGRILVGGGFPVNFNNINSVAPEVIDFTMAMSVAAAVEAMEGDERVFKTLERHSGLLAQSRKEYLDRLTSNLAHEAP